jgi:hypothetical protein
VREAAQEVEVAEQRQPRRRGRELAVASSSFFGDIAEDEEHGGKEDGDGVWRHPLLHGKNVLSSVIIVRTGIVLA